MENVAKVSVITGEFNGHSVSGLIHYCWVYFAVTMGFDLLQAFVLENIQVPRHVGAAHAQVKGGCSAARRRRTCPVVLRHPP